MRKTMFLGLFAVLMAFSASAQRDTVEDLLKRANGQRDSWNEATALELYKKALELDSDNYEALHNASYMSSKVGFRKKDETVQTRYYRQAETWANKATEVNPEGAEGWFAKSVAMGRIALIASPKEKVAAVHDIKNAVDNALRYNAKHAGAWHILGIWHYEVANANFAEKAAAKLLFGGLPKGASFDNSEKALKNAIRYLDNYIWYYTDLARTYVKLDQPDLARQTAEKALSLKSVSPDDEWLKQECRDIIADL